MFFDILIMKGLVSGASSCLTFKPSIVGGMDAQVQIKYKYFKHDLGLIECNEVLRPNTGRQKLNVKRRPQSRQSLIISNVQA